jgi:putative ABC transport system permease protein
MLSSSIFKVAKARTIISKFMLYGTAQALFIILVAAVGILNVMLADVTRRTREFAIRLAFGASHRDIFIIVLSQSCLVGLIGSSGGVLLSVFLSRPVAQLVAAQIPQAAQAQPSITLVGVLLPLGVCTACAFLAGLLPALKVRRLDVLASLRQEK